MTPPARTAPPSGASRPRRVDESMTLLVEMMDRPLDPSYAAEADRREAAGLSRSSARPWTIALVALLVGLLLVTAGRALRQPRDVVAGQKAALIEQIQSQQHAADLLATQRSTLAAQISAARDAALSRQSRADLAARLTDAETIAGTTAVTGPGIQLTIDDAARAAGGGSNGDPRNQGGQDMGKVVSRDLQLVVNGLWASGAEAVSINGQRLTSTSAIRFAGDAILVDYRPLARPYVVSAIGDPKTLEDAFVHSDGGVYIQGLSDSYGIVYQRATRDSLTCPAGTAVGLRSARVPGASAASPSTSPSGTSPSGSTSASSPGSETAP